MKLLQLVLATVAVAGIALAGDGPSAPEAGMDAPSVISALGLITGALLILRSRRK